MEGQSRILEYYFCIDLMAKLYKIIIIINNNYLKLPVPKSLENDVDSVGLYKIRLTSSILSFNNRIKAIDGVDSPD